ncbi:MAG TPA: M23 family metallopeptidase [Peptococcaceae bacterium]|nr:M23 family metallopeptidase [Peptococcaceae bacterium]
MNPFERWDDWEWEKAAHEIGRNYKYYERDEPGYRRDRPYYYRSESPGDFLDRFTGSQKRVVLSALLFLTIVFSAKGDDLVSQSVYSFYRTGMDSGSLYTTLNSLAKEAMGIQGEESIPVNFPIEEIFYPPVAGAVKVGFQGKNYLGEVSRGIEIESSLGTPVLCPQEGVVLEISESLALGRKIRINFGNGWEGILGNLGDVAVEQGSPVAMGTKLGTVGISSAQQKPWLYFELLKNGEPVNPLHYLIQNK